VTAVIAHQGDWLEAPGGLEPNSVNAVLAGLRAGADGAEFDVRMSADGVVVMHHDAHIGAPDVSAGCGLREGTAVYAAKRADLGHLSTLVELLEAVGAWAAEAKGRSPVLNVELKDLPGEPGWDEHHTLARLVARLLMDAGVGQWLGPGVDGLGVDGLGVDAPGVDGLVRVVVSSFDPEALVELRRQAPRLSTGLLLAAGSDWRDAISRSGGWRALHPAHVDAGPELFSAASAAGLAVVPWTVDDTSRAVALAGMGAAAVITNRPRSVLAALGR
jgi:glycerophosphoryl diester phosphodiesterase